MLKNLTFALAVLATLIFGLAIGYSISANRQDVVQLSSIPSPTPSLDFSYYENLIKQNQEVMIKRLEPVDLTGDGKAEVIYITAGEGCVSCHEQTIRIFDGQKEIFNEKMFDDPIFVPGNKAFMVFRPVRKEGEPLCCPTSFSLTTYLWDGQTFKVKEEELREPVMQF